MATIEHRDLRSALEYAVLIAAEGQKRRPPLPFPKDLKPLIGSTRLTSSALGRVRRIVESDPGFRSAISAGALPELVDDVGRLWLAGGEGWEERAAALIAERRSDAADRDLQRDLRRSEKRRIAAEQAAARVQADVLARDVIIADQATSLDDLRAEVSKVVDEMAALRAELVDARNEARHARDRERAAVQRAERNAHGAVEVESDRVPTGGRADNSGGDVPDDRIERLIAARDAAREFVDHVDALFADPDPSGSVRDSSVARRTPLALPGGVIATSQAAAEVLVRAGALVLVDGYNVSKLQWPQRSLEDQRDALVSRVENLARRHDVRITVVFDGSSVIGAHAPVRRLVRVVYSPDGVTADDVIRAEIARLPVDEPVVVVTNDREIVSDVRAVGANVIPSNAFAAVL